MKKFITALGIILLSILLIDSMSAKFLIKFVKHFCFNFFINEKGKLGNKLLKFPC